MDLTIDPSQPKLAPYSVAFAKPPERVVKWCQSWELAARVQGVQATLRAYTKIRSPGLPLALHLVMVDGGGRSVRHSLGDDASRTLAEATADLAQTLGLPAVRLEAPATSVPAT